MATATAPVPPIREAVASFADREHFRSAVAALRAAGFASSDISVLASHESLSTADQTPAGLIAAELTNEINLIGPLTLAGFAFVSGGPIAVALAAVVGAGLGGAALKELLDDFAAAPHHEEFAAALSAGAVLLWVRCADAEVELRATRILEASGGSRAHIHARSSAAPEV